MAVTISPQVLQFGSWTVEDTSVTPTAVTNIRNGPCRVRTLVIGNSAGSAAAFFLKLWDHGNPTVGSDAPDYCFPIPTGTTVIELVNHTAGEEEPGVYFGTGFSYAATLNDGTSDTTALADTATLKITGTDA